VRILVRRAVVWPQRGPTSESSIERGAIGSQELHVRTLVRVGWLGPTPFHGSRDVRQLVAAVCLATVAGLADSAPAVAANNTWTNAAANLTWNTTSANWSSPTVWNNANVDSAVFGATGVGTITLQDPITARAVQFDTAGYTLSGTGANVLTLATGGGGSLGVGEVQANANATIAAAIAGTVGLTKTGSGVLTLTGQNTFTGGTTVNAGTLQIGDGVATPTPATLLENVTINNTSVLQFNKGSGANATYAGNYSGTGSLVKSGSGHAILSGTHTYTGGTTVNGGQLTFEASLTGNVAVNSATLNFAQVSGTVMYAGVISGPGFVNKQSGSRLILTADQTYAGDTQVIGSGVLQLGNGGTAGMISTAVGIGQTARLEFNRSDAVTFAPVISGTGGITIQGAGTITLTGANTYSGVTTINAGTLSIGNGGTTGTVAGNITNNAALRFDRSDAVSYGGVISGTGTVTKLGAGTLTLSGANTYTGATTVTGGTLALTGTASFASSPTIQVNTGTTLNVTGLTGGSNHDGTRFALANGQTLKGLGTIDGGVDVRNGATLAAGGSPGTTSVTGNVDFQAGSTLRIQLNGLGDTDADRSRLLLTGALTFAGASGNPFTVDVTNSGSFSGTTTATYTIASAGSIGSTGLDSTLSLAAGAGGSGTATNTSNVRLNVSGFVAGEQFSLQRSGNFMLLSFTPVPEPATILGIALAGTGAVEWWRRKRLISRANRTPP
jgi:autotransporter-associated beta strand protein